MRKIALTIGLVMILAIACNKEEAIKPSAEFTTNIQNNTLQRNKNFMLYLDKAEGEFIVYFRGNNEQSTYDPNDARRIGINVTKGIDSVEVQGYPAIGEYAFTVVASSSGNWAKDYVQDVKSINITVVEPTGK